MLKMLNKIKGLFVNSDNSLEELESWENPSYRDGVYAWKPNWFLEIK